MYFSPNITLEIVVDYILIVFGTSRERNACFDLQTLKSVIVINAQSGGNRIGKIIKSSFIGVG